MAVDISPKAREFEEAIVSVMLKHADKLDSNEAYQALVLVYPRVLGGLVSHLKKGKSDKDIRKIFSEILENVLSDDPDAVSELLH